MGLPLFFAFFSENSALSLNRSIEVILSGTIATATRPYFGLSFSALIVPKRTRNPTTFIAESQIRATRSVYADSFTNPRKDLVSQSSPGGQAVLAHETSLSAGKNGLKAFLCV
jgi:hypothetical protein